MRWVKYENKSTLPFDARRRNTFGLWQQLTQRKISSSE